MSPSVPELERGFALTAAVLCVLAIATAGVVGIAQPQAADLAYQQDVPAEYEFTAPTADGVARVGDEQFDSIEAALDAASPGDVVTLRGHFQEDVVVETPGITLAGAGPDRTLIEGNGTGDVLHVEAPNVTVRDLWVKNSGYKASENDAAIWVNGSHATVEDSRVTDMTFGIWLDSGSDIRVANNTIVGRESVTPLSDRGNGIQIWKVTESVVENNRITDVRDGIYYSWASDVLGQNNTMWDLRYGVHYMYSDDCRLANNTAFDNDVGYALMVSDRLLVEDNVAVNNSGQSGHGIMIKTIDHSTVRHNDLVNNHKGLYVYNSQDNALRQNLVVGNDIGIHLTAGSTDERVSNNSFIRSDEDVRAVVGEQVVFTEGVGNYWSDATLADLDNDGISDTRYKPAGAVTQLTEQQPAARVFASSPAFAAIRVAEASVPLIEANGVVDERPLMAPPHRNWTTYYDRN